jgi:catechol 2,3-dioxygenase-like lactoylglutathione lyase family enzyme
MNERCGFGAIRSVDYVIVLCNDLEKMKHFYASLFGFAVEDEEEGHWVAFRVGTLLLGLRPRGRSYDGPKVSDTSAKIQLRERLIKAFGFAKLAA